MKNKKKAVKRTYKSHKAWQLIVPANQLVQTGFASVYNSTSDDLKVIARKIKIKPRK